MLKKQTVSAAKAKGIEDGSLELNLYQKENFHILIKWLGQKGAKLDRLELYINRRREEFPIHTI